MKPLWEVEDRRMTPEEEKANMHKPYHAWTYMGESVWKFTGFDIFEDAQAYARENNSRDVSCPNGATWKNPDYDARLHSR